MNEFPHLPNFNLNLNHKFDAQHMQEYCIIMHHWQPLYLTSNDYHFLSFYSIPTQKDRNTSQGNTFQENVEPERMEEEEKYDNDG